MLSSEFDQNLLLDTANAMADAARPIALKYFRGVGLGTSNKLSVGFDPVTIADKEVETAFRDILQKECPNDGILGEEFPNIESKSGLTWVLDPIDGTRGFISGTPTWGMLIAVNDGINPILGVLDQPYTGERFIGGCGQAQLIARDNRLPLKVKACSELSEAILFSTMPDIGDENEVEAFNRVSKACKLTRFGMDCYAYGLLALGQIDLVIEAGLNPYDIQAPIAIVEAAGGIVTSWNGGSAADGGTVIAASDKRIYDQAIKLLN